MRSCTSASIGAASYHRFDFTPEEALAWSEAGIPPADACSWSTARFASVRGRDVVERGSTRSWRVRACLTDLGWRGF
jgi:hypothetical protein